MNKNLFQTAVGKSIGAIRAVEWGKMDISEYNYQYISRLLPFLDYYFRIYEDAVKRLLQGKVSEGYIVDFGGGHGFLSLFLKQLGLRVIYCDNNPLSVKTVCRIKETVGFGPDVVIEGSVPELISYCEQHQLNVNYLIATDLIEHLYDLDMFFAGMKSLNPSLQMLFTTGSNPCNRYKSNHLRKIMKEVELHYFLPMREEFIHKHFAELDEKESKELAVRTRGFIYSDVAIAIEAYIRGGILPEPIDRYNTCDPQSGNWMERILPLKTYRTIAGRNGFRVKFANGFYNADKGYLGVSIAVKMLNWSISHSGALGRVGAPYLILQVH
jgi:hypothetical protein